MLKDKLIKLSQNSKIVLSITIVAIVSLAMYNWVVSPLTAYLHAAQLHETVMNDVQERAAEIETQICAKQTELEKLEEEMSDTQSIFFTAARAKEFFLDLEPISAETGCDVESFEFVSTGSQRCGGGGDNDNGVIVRSAEISFNGGYGNIIKFLQRLGSCPERFSVNEIIIEPIAGERATRLKCRMTVTIYMIQDKEIVVDE